ncbi:MAG: serine/threonine protein kinase, partial [Candidatus Krumholzibacteria bacterium]|nr:serine/threonine protein kinase [Candidatus Krumholzibacteria bacterium]
MIGKKLAHYEILEQIGSGGMGEVYRARDERLSREVAVKVLPSSLLGDPDRLRRFEQEARATGQLNHPNILSVYDTGEHEGVPFVVAELLEGKTLRETTTGSPLPVRKSLDIAAQIARGLAAAHRKGIVHRDLKPEN